MTSSILFNYQYCCQWMEVHFLLRKVCFCNNFMYISIGVRLCLFMHNETKLLTTIYDLYSVDIWFFIGL